MMPSETTAAETSVNARVEELLAMYDTPDTNAAQVLCDQNDPDTVVYRVIADDLTSRDLTFGELRTESEKFAAVLQGLGVNAGDRVATLMSKSRNYLVAVMGIWRLGAVHVPLFTAFAQPAIAMRLQGSSAKVVVVDAKYRDKLAPSESIPANAPWKTITTGAADDGALSFDEVMQAASPGIASVAMGGNAPLIHIYTSGTTGNPKGVIVPIRALAAFRAYGEFGQAITHDDIFWCAADPGWAYGLYYGVLTTYLCRPKLSILFEGGFTPEASMAILANERVTNFAAAPTVYRSLRSAGITPPAPLSLSKACSAGEPLTPEVNEWALRELGVAVHDHYGQTETGMMINNHQHPDLQRTIKPRSMGRPMPGWSATILEEERDEVVPVGEAGRVVIDLTASPLAWFTGYYGDTVKTAERFSPDGRWYVTGDTGTMDDDGDFHFSARDDDVIIMAGYRIGPFEVESAMSTHPAVAETAVIAVPDEVRGEVIEAYVVLREGEAGSPELAKDIQNWVKTHFAAHAYPRQIHFTATIPKTPSGKIQRFILKQQRLDELNNTAAS